VRKQSAVGSRQSAGRERRCSQVRIGMTRMPAVWIDVEALFGGVQKCRDCFLFEFSQLEGKG